jgi:hypothetical protein
MIDRSCDNIYITISVFYTTVIILTRLKKIDRHGANVGHLGSENN